MTLQDYLNKADKKKVFEQILIQARSNNNHNPCFTQRHDDYIKDIQDQQFEKPLAGSPIALKDNMLLKATTTSFGSLMSGDYVAPYSATVVKKLEQAGAICIGKTSLDEFAMGGKGENSPLAIPHNALDPNRVPGGSSSGGAIAVANGSVPIALGTDTGGSVRLPAARNGVWGFKPSYGALSRYGIQAMASSFDQVGIFASQVEDVKEIFTIVRGQDDRDASSKDYNFSDTIHSLKGLRIGLVDQHYTDALDPRIADFMHTLVDRLKDQGATIVNIDMPLIDSAVGVYYTLVNAEVSTNLARFDGLKYGLQSPSHEASNHEHYRSKKRSEGFGLEVKRRILLGAHILSASEYEGLYVKAMNIRSYLTQEFKQLFENQVDVILSPVSPSFPPLLGEKVSNPVKDYLADMYTVVANITGMPALSVPLGTTRLDKSLLAYSCQIMGNHGSDSDILQCGKLINNLYHSKD